LYIPKTMMNEISNAFYDKEVDTLERKTTIDEEGGVINNGYDIISTFKGNVSFSNCKKIQEDYGLDYKIDISITTGLDVDINMDNYIKYQNIIYDVTDVLPCDSHILIVATKCQQ